MGKHMLKSIFDNAQEKSKNKKKQVLLGQIVNSIEIEAQGITFVAIKSIPKSKDRVKMEAVQSWDNIKSEREIKH